MTWSVPSDRSTEARGLSGVWEGEVCGGKTETASERLGPLYDAWGSVGLRWASI